MNNVFLRVSAFSRHLAEPTTSAAVPGRQTPGEAARAEPVFDEGIRLTMRLSVLFNKFLLYGGTIGWLLVDVYRHAKGRCVGIFALSLTGVLARGSAIGVLLYFIHAQVQDRAVVLFGREIPSDTSLPTLVLWGGVVLVLALVTGAATYSAEVGSFRLARDAMNRAIDRVLTVVAAGQSRPLSVWNDGGMNTVSRKALMGDVMMLMRAVFLISGLTVPLATFLIATAVLFVLNVKLTAILAPVLLIYTVPFYHLNRAVVNASREFEERKQARASVLGRLLRFASQTQYPGIDHPAWADLYRSDPAVSDAVDAFRGIIMSRRRIAFLQDVFLGVILFTLLVVFGLFLASDELAWVPLLSYLIALRYAMTGIGGIAALVTAANRFAPQLKRLREFTSADVHTAAIPAAPENAKLRIFRPVDPKIEDTMPSATPQPGDIVACIGPKPIDSYRLLEFCKQLLGRSKGARELFGEMFFYGNVHEVPELRVAQLITGESEPDAGSVQEASGLLKRLGVLDEVNALAEGLDTVLTSESYTQLSPFCRYVLCLVPGLRSQRRYFVLSWPPLARLEQSARVRILEVLCDRVVLLLSTVPARELLDRATLVAVLDESKVCGIGDAGWFERVTSKGLAEDRKVAAMVRAAEADPRDEDELLDDL